jgi:Tfp pilus assembly protein PilF
LSAADIAILRLVRVELLSTRALLSLLRAPVDPIAAQQLRWLARDQAERAAQLFAGIDTSVLDDPARVERARARLRLVQGAPVDPGNVRALEPETRVLLASASLWDESAPAVPRTVIDQLEALEQPSMVARLALALAHVRTEDDEAASKVLEQILAQAPEQPIALAMRQHLASETPPLGESGETAPDTGAQPDASVEDTPVELDAPSAPETPDRPVASASRDPAPSGSGSGMSVARLIDKGCTMVEEGKASEGVELLQRAKDKRPKEIDVLICLGEGYLKLKNYTAALRHFEQAASRSPRLGSALRGAARAAAKAGNVDTAVNWYQRVLDGEPRNAEAAKYLAEHRPAL